MLPPPVPERNFERTMHEEIAIYLRENNGATSVKLAEEFLKFKDPAEALARKAIAAVLKSDGRCFFGEDGLWHARELIAAQADSAAIRDVKWHALYVLCPPAGNSMRPVHISIWSITPLPELETSLWLTDPETLPHEERALLQSGLDRPFNPLEIQTALESLGALGEQGIPILLSARDYALVRHIAAKAGSLFTDDAVLISQLFSAAGIALPKPLSLPACYRALFGVDPALSSAAAYGEALAQCAGELFARLSGQGIITIADLEEAENKEPAAFDFSGKNFTYNDIAQCPKKPGVYAFKDKSGAFLYIGKASSLRRRIMGYFRNSEESPEKLTKLREAAYILTTSVCGSELESLIYEYRLIAKHTPLLNSKIGIDERAGHYRPINDCIILLPHAQTDKGMSFWFRRNQKTALKPFPLDFDFSLQFRQDLENFFFSDKLPPAASDFPEQEIAYRWLRHNEEGLVSIPVDRIKNVDEAIAAIKDYWREVET
jgi:hypothetical protein